MGITRLSWAYWVLGVCALLLTVGVETSQAQADLPRFDETDCFFVAPDIWEVECGFVTVAAARDEEGNQVADAGTVRLPVAVFYQIEAPEPADAETTTEPVVTPVGVPFSDDETAQVPPEVTDEVAVTEARGPVIYLAGGPGASGLESQVPSFDVRWQPFLEYGDFILYDQRGTGMADPALTCAEFPEFRIESIDEMLSLEASLEYTIDIFFACRDRLAAENVDLSLFNSAASAADLNDIRIALGYDSWNLIATSYGARLALTHMRDFPDTVRSVILDSGYPPEINLYADAAANAYRAFDVLFERCAADTACNEAFPDLETVFYDAVDALNEGPTRVSVTNPRTGDVYERAYVNGEVFIEMVYQMLHETTIIPLLPTLIYNVSSGNYELLSRLIGATTSNLEFVSLGKRFSTHCHEEISFADEITVPRNIPEQIARHFELSLELGPAITIICDHWQAGEAAPIENEPIVSDIPTLLLAGEFDPLTPPAYSEQIAENLSTNTLYVLPGYGHSITLTHDECIIDLMQTFLNDPMSEPSVSCVGALEFEFVVPSGD
ncbi:MAG: alpha/beta hydrolase [Chloroflexi bacterium]|nr:alpha/beta hydrolase [Chloroflexota bacterium]